MEPNNETGGLLDGVKADIAKLSEIVDGLAKSIMTMSDRVGALEVDREAEKAQISDNEDLRSKLVDLGDEVAKAAPVIEWANRILPKYFQGDKPVGNFSDFNTIGRDIK